MAQILRSPYYDRKPFWIWRGNRLNSKLKTEMAAPTSVSTGRCGDPICAVSERVGKYKHVAINKEKRTVESICDQFLWEKWRNRTAEEIRIHVLSPPNSWKKDFQTIFFPILFLEVTVIIFVQWLVGITGFRMTYKVSVFFHMKMFVQSSKIWMLYQKRPLTLRASLRDIRWYE